MMLDRVFCKASETERAPIPDIVISVETPMQDQVNERITVTITRTAITRNATLISRITVGFVFAAFAGMLDNAVNAFFNWRIVTVNADGDSYNQLKG